MSRRPRFLLPLAAGLGLALAFVSVRAAPAPLILFNVSPSLPQGAWRFRMKAPGLGDVVALRPPAGASRYLAGLGYPPDGLLLKRVVAAGAGRACASGKVLQAGDWAIPRRSHDRRGTPIPAWSGCRLLRPDEFIVLGASSESFDSRYFGPIRAAEVVGVYEQLP